MKVEARRVSCGNGNSTSKATESRASRATGLRRDEETAELNGKFKAVGARDAVPADPSVAVLESLGGTGPT